MNRKRNILGVSSNSNSEKRDTSLWRSGVQTPARGTSQQPSRAVTSQQPSRGGMSQPSRAVALLAAESAGRAEGSHGTAMPLPPIRLPAAAVTGPDTTHVQAKKQMVHKNPAPPPGQRNLPGAPQAGTSPLPSSRLCTSQQQQLQPQQPQRSRPTPHRGRSVRNPGTARYTINLSADATWLLLRRHLENERGWMNPFGSTGLLPGSQIRAGLDLTSLMKVSFLNDQNRYDDEEYEEDPAPGDVDQELVHRCTEWLRGVEKAKREDKLRTLPHLYDP